MKLKTLLLFPLLVAPVAIQASEIVTHKSAGAIARVEWVKLSGRVEEKDAENRRLRLRDKNGNVAQVTIDESVQIFRDWRLIALNDVRMNDHLILKRNEIAAK